MIDIVLLRLIKHRKEWSMLKDVIPKSNLSDETLALVADFGKYFEAYPSHEQLDLLTFMPKFRTWHAGITDEQFASYTAILRNISPEPDEDQRRNILQDLADIELMTKVANTIEQFKDGEVVDPYSSITEQLDNYRKRRGLKVMTYIDTPIGDLLQQEFDDAGVKWRLNALNNSTRPLRPGDFGIVAGRPDQGKTTFITSEATYWAPQLPDDLNVIWLNNEGPGDRIIPRLYQSALGISMSDMKLMHAEGKLVDAYRAKIGGRLDKIRVFDIHGKTTGMVANILEENKAGIAIFDMIDNIHGFGDAARTDLMLEKMYQWARELMVRLNCIGIATSQISQDGDDMRFPALPMLKDSKTGKQGACDFQLMIGSISDPAFQYSRFLSLPKNKLMRPDGKKDPKAEVQFDPVRARYEDMQMELTP
ncbi:putative DNA helicase DnaB-like protein [Rhizobium phage RHph_Y48]|uniref:Putative DNA helicase DnaB-like protein n=1 Tax=Rhizobium phage RHph_Y1_20 TaxID=2509571 RepID=A0A7S5RA18_9CAUD|nr:putative DNA helicase DnaB-like protein [Rhizobium phage RHph_Y1_20]QIG69961.1 putative DNA helicase DnaB-like protein [Rhizobium phage RHph_Y48]QIG70013.1 putative DNA helicase DnaB-like protein [Rhizobium phage RHph_Y86]QIG70065.1 putative DNA helicase DnaB-like protein [Rhizobium phage RHph_Y2_7]